VGFAGVALAFGLTLLTMALRSGTSADATSIRRLPSGFAQADAFPQVK